MQYDEQESFSFAIVTSYQFTSKLNYWVFFLLSPELFMIQENILNKLDCKLKHLHFHSSHFSHICGRDRFLNLWPINTNKNFCRTCFCERM